MRGETDRARGDAKGVKKERRGTMADKNAEVAVEDNGGMKKTLSLWNFFTIGFGAIMVPVGFCRSATGWSWAAVPFPL